MANGEGIVEEVLVKGRYDGEEVAKGIPESVDKGMAAAIPRMKKAEREGLTAFLKMQKATGKSIKELAETINRWGMHAEDARLISKDLGITLGEEVAPAVEETTSAFNRVGDAVKFAVFRFFTALIIYQAFRKVLRAISEAITESIRLWKELAEAQAALATSLRINERLFETQLGTLREWSEWARYAALGWGTTQAAMLQAAAAVMRANESLNLQATEMQDLIRLGAAVAQMNQWWKDGTLDVARGTEIVVSAIQGKKEAMRALFISEKEVAEAVGLTVEEFRTQGEAFQEAARYAVIVTESSDAIVEAAQEAATGVQASSARIDAAISDVTLMLGESIAKLKLIFKAVELGLKSLVVWLVTMVEKGETATKMVMGMIPGLGMMAEALGMGMEGAQWLADQLGGLTSQFQESGEAAKDYAEHLLFVQGVLSSVRKAISAVTRAISTQIDKLRAAMEQVKEAAQPYIDLGRAIGEAMIDNLRSAEDAARNFGRRMADLAADLVRDIARLGRRFEARAAELILRAEERKADIREDFRKREEQERDDLNLRLKHMEEDFLLDMKHLREQYEMDIEEAARARDWRAIRTLQRRYGLERRQRGEDYQLSRKQFIESWEQRHKQRKKDLDEELKEVEDNLAKQLAALERERQRELAELKIRGQERRDELKAQYAQELADLQRNLERRLADILTAAIQEGTIQIGEATKVTQTLASLYGINAQNLETMVSHDITWLQAWASAWDQALGAVRQARARATMFPYPFPTAPFAFAKGGMAIATRPTLVKVGEAGPELFTAIPLGKGGSVLGGMRNYMSGDFNLNISGDQMGQWSGDFERQVTDVVAGIFREAFEE